MDQRIEDMPLPPEVKQAIALLYKHLNGALVILHIDGDTIMPITRVIGGHGAERLGHIMAIMEMSAEGLADLVEVRLAEMGQDKLADYTLGYGKVKGSREIGDIIDRAASGE